MAAFAIATELKEQIKTATEDPDSAGAAITFVDVASIEDAKAEKAEETVIIDQAALDDNVDPAQLTCSVDPLQLILATLLGMMFQY